ncbi:MAG: RDD family protein [Methanobrevibacter sp.]|uniref:RDD family protein n=1 Tax=Methanobrevibacter sp. TaxID=66852 RepID=UPI0025DF7871|nr:RDD family protein [Methanobrevibacter sp.]MBR0272086.1 RDD family protein [Methanobrevibacter sp.]
MASLFTRRFLAYVIDFFVVSAFMWIVSYLLSIFVNPYSSYTVYMYFPYVTPVLTLIYFIVLEKIKGATVGKALMYLRVISRNGYPISWIQAIIRNLTKIYWFPVIFDWAIGKIIRRDERILGVITKTIVVNEIE